MSYNVAIVVPPVPSDDAEAWAALDGLIEQEGARPAVFQDLHDRLTAAYPCMAAAPDEEVDDCVWSDGPLIDNFLHRAAVLGMSYSHVEEVLPFLVGTANALGLVAFDWATSRVYRPSHSANNSPSGPARGTASGLKKREMQALIHDMLGGILEKTGFRLRKGEGFARNITGGRQVLVDSLMDYRPEYKLSITTCIRLDSAEEIFHRFSGAEPKYHRMSFTTMTGLEYFTGGPGEYLLETPGDVEAAGTALRSVLRERIVPFLDSYQDALSLDRAVNRERTGFDMTQPPSGAIHAVILAYLARNPDFDQVVAHQRDKFGVALEVDHDFNRDFNPVVEYLQSARLA